MPKPESLLPHTHTDKEIIITIVIRAQKWSVSLPGSLSSLTENQEPLTLIPQGLLRDPPLWSEPRVPGLLELPERPGADLPGKLKHRVPSPGLSQNPLGAIEETNPQS